MGQPQQPDQAEAEESGAPGPDAGAGAGAGAGTAGVSSGAASPGAGPRAAGLAGGLGKPPLRVGMVGYAFMGAAHSQGWRTAGRVFDLPLAPVLAAVCGRDGDAVRAMADRHGWATTETDWRELIARDDIDLVDICTPGDSHAEIALAALAAGKHVLCEKPLANTVAEAEAMTTAAEEAYGRGRLAMVGFNYRRVPATALARRMVAQGRLGALRHVRVTYLQDWLVDPEFPLTWRLRKESAGSGALGDLGAHIVDLAQYVAGEPVVGVSALMETFVRERPLPAGVSAGLASSGGTAGRGAVTVDDTALFTGRFASGAVASFEATRFATGRKNALRIELNGERGSLAFDLERLNELAYHDHTEPGTHAGFRRILVTEPDHPYLDAWWPPGHGLGYEHSFVHQARDLVHAVAAGRQPEPSFADGLQVQRVLAAVEESAEKNSVYTPTHTPTAV
ncbi:Gfo/Idh/MocA family oxidoreductase [Streptomyces europaeiscabiei]|uniref:Gfo/Idh/MocA family protein n=1 Tax=Streptomyces TaxID=1883 RepID=UPI000A3A06D6|nr:MULTISPECIES: Gfo/Idh/MocA family oxidoreductase [Streptomyces]MDX3612674.1 Gfo/Idh/MocA family oxidoreductase [Streptomyces europaeiscabiei]MDX3632342.1 Gfo/Idh/MocA family oxidoreductase [Streptomyces europaeiscabiei]MDX3646625.1 Gfo/Idh/MocA family oxidoreductase [Streptomyces europaeiscabiei]